MDDLTDYLKRRHPEIGKTISFTDFVRRMNRVLHVPSDTAVAATEASTGESVDSFFSDDGAAEPETVVSGQPSDGSDSLNRRTPLRNFSTSSASPTRRSTAGRPTSAP
jgi:hypothetical protein